MDVGLVFYFILQLSWLIPTAAQLYSNACNETCGDVPIPYPFGIRSGCYDYNSWFRVTCNETATGQKPFISRINLEVVDWYQGAENLVVVNNPVTYLNCGNKTTSSSVNLQGSPFFFSSRFNQFGSVGCGHFAAVFGNNQTNPISSCLQKSCGDLDSKLPHGCHAVIPENITSYTASMTEILSVAGSNRCTSAFILTSQRPPYPSHYYSYGYELPPSDSKFSLPDDISIDTTHVPAALEWNPCDLEAELCRNLDTFVDGYIQSCGNVDIPYPFGTEVYMNEWFRVTCNETTDGSRPYLTMNGLQLLSVSFLEGTNVVNNSITYSNCLKTDGVSVNLTGTPFLFSASHNRFVSVGCDSLATFHHSPTDDYPLGGCLQPICANFGTLNVSCSSDIPWDLSSYSVNMKEATYPNNSSRRSCGSAFIIDQRYLEAINLNHNAASNWTLTHVPTTLQWSTPIRGWCDCRDGPNAFWSPDGQYRWSKVGQSYLCVCAANDDGFRFVSTDICQDQSPPCRYHYRYSYMLCLNTLGNKCSSSSPSCPSGYQYSGDVCVPLENLTVKSEKSHYLAISIGCSTSLGTLFVLLGTWHLYKVLERRKSIKLKKKYFKRNGGLLLQQHVSNNEGNVERVRLFASEELEKATDYFNENRILGRGGQGTVYKGMLTDGGIVAIKKSKLVEEKIFDETKLEQFINEVMILSQINHRNVVKLLGCCLETKVPLLVYEFIPNGTLYHLIHEPNAEFPLTWEMRLRIAIEIANALSYLHSAASVPIYHRDIKSSNILLDDKYKAKVSDFGTSRSVAVEQTHVTTRVQGTFGYMDPEYFRSNQFTEKSDVYSFGVVLVELVTGQKPISSSQSEEVVRSLANFFLLSMKENSLLDIVDPVVQNGGPEEEFVAVAKLAKRCLNLNGKKRPTMKQVALELEWIRSSEEANAIQQSADEDSDTTDDMFEVSNITSCSTTGSVLKDSVTRSLDA
ncbi:hypothetical protein V6N13_054838 [Hibiscus sabdariffa]|uniref:Protein kinase domain-containing protein n=1 Tax=Hibiscus sabdariffa TaxID=183260 RepID=A0ABR2DWK8_9ROSI